MLFTCVWLFVGYLLVVLSGYIVVVISWLDCWLAVTWLGWIEVCIEFVSLVFGWVSAWRFGLIWWFGVCLGWLCSFGLRYMFIVCLLCLWLC